MEAIKEEIWKPIPDTKGVYQVSNLGRVKSSKLKQEKILKPYQNDNYLLPMGTISDNLGQLIPLGKKFLRVKLCTYAGIKCHFVHKLVANAYVPKPSNETIVHHIDGNKHNNNSSNLVWSLNRKKPWENH
jgi:hypothetical protein